MVKIQYGHFLICLMNRKKNSEAVVANATLKHDGDGVLFIFKS